MLALAFVRRADVGRAAHAQVHRGETVEIALGWSIVLYAALGALMSGFRPLFQRGRWEIHCLLSGVCTALIVLAEYLMITFRREPVVFVFDKDIWWRIGGAGLVAMLLVAVLFLRAQLPRVPRRLRSAAGAQTTPYTLIWPVALPASPSAELRVYLSRLPHALRPRRPRARSSGGSRWRAARCGPRRSPAAREVTVRIPSVRGEIRDRNGITLVANRASYEVDFYLPDMVRGYGRQHGHGADDRVPRRSVPGR